MASKKIVEPGTEQFLLDLGEVRERLAALKRAIQKQDRADEVVRKLTTDLACAKRKAKEARWEVAALVKP